MPTPTNQTLPSGGSYLLRSWRVQRNLSQTEAAQILGVDQGRYSQLERGRRKPGLAHAVRFERATGGAVPAVAWCDPAPIQGSAS